MSAPEPQPVRGPDRRQGPRRAEEATLHYAREALLAAALDLAGDRDLQGGGEPMAKLRRAARDFQDAEQAAR